MVSQEFEYDPWGNLRMLSGWAPEFTFTGQQWDDDLGINLFYLRNRYYDPAIGRFTTPDPLVSDLNPYSYANNNPVMLVDPSGLSGIRPLNGPVPPGARRLTPPPSNIGPVPGDPDYVDPNYKPRLGPDGRPLLNSGGTRGGFQMGSSLYAITGSGAIGGHLESPTVSFAFSLGAAMGWSANQISNYILARYREFDGGGTGVKMSLSYQSANAQYADEPPMLASVDGDEYAWLDAKNIQNPGIEATDGPKYMGPAFPRDSGLLFKYVDINWTYAYGIGWTMGVQIADNGVHLYAGPAWGVALLSPIPTVTFGGPTDPAKGWAGGLQLSYGLAFQGGYSCGDGGSWFGEIGIGAPSATFSLYHVWTIYTW